MERIKELKKQIEKIEVTYNYDETYTNLKNTCIDYMNESQDWDFEQLFEDIIDYDLAEEMAKYQLEQGGLVRLYYFMGDANFNNDIFRVNGYGNLCDIYKDDLDNLKDDILSLIDEKLSE